MRNDLLFRMGQEPNVFSALRLLGAETDEAIDLEIVRAYEHSNDAPRLRDWIARCRSIDDFRRVVQEDDSDYRLAFRRSQSHRSGQRGSGNMNEHIGIREPKRSMQLEEQLAGYGHFLTASSEEKPQRYSQLEELQLVLNKRTKNNALLVGAAGCGKSYLVESLAGPWSQLERRVFSVDVAKMMGGTKFRGELETRFSFLVQQARKHRFILFIDEMHALADMGAAEGGFNIVDLLKPHLTAADFQMIGATTPGELSAITSDAAFRRRFSILYLGAMTGDMLVRIFEEACVAWSLPVEPLDFDWIVSALEREIPEESFPDKLLDYLEYFDSCMRSNFVETSGLSVRSQSVMKRFIALRGHH